MKATRRAVCMWYVAAGLLLLAALHRSAAAQYVDANRRIYVLARETALGMSNLCFGRDGAPNTSPANLALDSSAQLQLGYAGYYRNVYSSTLLSYVTNLGRLGAFGVSADYLYVPGIEDTRDLAVDGSGLPIYDPARVTQVSASEIALNLAYGRRWTPGERVDVDAGAALQVLRRRLIDWTGYGVGLHVAGAVTFRRSGVRAGLLLENLTTTYMHWSEHYSENALPHLRLGLGWRRDIPYIYGALQITYASPDLLSNEGINATNAISSADSLESPRSMTLREDPQMLLYGNYGLEYSIARIVHLRVGVENLRRFAFGAGLALWQQHILVDFAWLSHELGGSYSLTVGYRWP